MWLRGHSSRREALLSLWRAFVFFRFPLQEARAADTGVRGLLETHPASSVRRFHRRYRAHAAILVLGMPVFKRGDVGAGFASVETGVSGDRTVTALQFAAGSDPERARGLNRLGIMREAAVEQDLCLLKTSYAGFMTSSPEKSLDQGRRALDTSAAALPCTLGSAESWNGRTELSVRRFTVPGTTRWMEAADILNAIENCPETNHETGAFGPSATFLYAVHRAALEDASNARRQFCHNGKLHELVTEKRRLSSDSRIIRMTGSIRDPSGAETSVFSLWFDSSDPSGLPARIEFRPRPFLRLTFEAEAGSSEAQAAFPWLIDEKRA
jgi:hypothetical protein